MTLERVLAQRFKKKEIGEKEQLLTKTYKYYKASKFLLKNDLSSVYFDIKETLRVFILKFENQRAI